MQSPLISIILPVKNAGKYLHDCLESIQKQSIEDWELVIVDDHSADDSVVIIHSFIVNDPRIRLCTNEGDGIIIALQTAFHQCRGKFITRMDADDVMPIDRLNVMFQAIQGTEKNTIVTGKVKYFSDHPISSGYQKYEKWLNERIDYNDHWKWVYRECVIASPGWMAHKQALMDHKILDELNYPEDYDLVLKWYRSNFEIKTIPQIILNWREHPNRISRLSDQYNQENFFRLKLKHFVSHDLNEKSRLLIWGTNKKGKLTARLLISWNVPFSWMTLYPNDHPMKIYNKEIEHFELDQIARPFQLLIAVYPEHHQLIEMTEYLKRNELFMGEDYWFL